MWELSPSFGNGFQNDGDNEITGFHISDGDPTLRGILGAKSIQALHRGARVFFTQQHGENATWEILARPTADRDGDDGDRDDR